MTTPFQSAEAAATPPRSPRTGENGRPATDGHSDGLHGLGNATSRRRTVSGSKQISTRTETNHPCQPIGALERATVAAMPGSPAPIAETARVSAHVAEPYRHGIKPRRRTDAARGEIERPRAIGEISKQEPASLSAAHPRPYHLLIGDAIVLPLLPQAGGRVATTCVTQRTLTPIMREAKAARKASLAERNRAQRQARY